MRDLNEDAGTVAGFSIATAGATMRQVYEDMDTFDDNVVRFLAFDVSDKPYAASIAFIARVIESMRLRKSLKIIRFFHYAKTAPPLRVRRQNTWSAPYTGAHSEPPVINTSKWTAPIAHNFDRKHSNFEDYLEGHLDVMPPALEGIRVIEITEALAGPYCAMLLGDLGADVIKVERPGIGDQSRSWGPPFIGSESAYFLATNRNKRSLTLNYDQAHGREILQRLIAAADIVMFNNPSLASLARRGMDPDTLCKQHPRLIYCAISGYGFSGPKAGLPGYDIIAQAEAGVWSFTGNPDTQPVRYPVAIADITCGIYATIGILAALFAREKTGRGQFLDTALLDCQLTWLANIGSNYLNAHESPQRWGNAHPSIVPYQVFRGSDGRHFVVAIGTELLWSRFTRVLGAEETLGRDPRFASNALRTKHRNELILTLEGILQQSPSATWLEHLSKAQVPAAAIQTVGEALNDPQTLARGLIVSIEHPAIGVARSIANPVRLSGTPPLYRLPPPMLGEHTEAILRELRCSPDDIAASSGNSP